MTNAVTEVLKETLALVGAAGHSISVRSADGVAHILLAQVVAEIRETNRLLTALIGKETTND